MRKLVLILSYESGALHPRLYLGCLAATIFFDRPARVDGTRYREENDSFMKV